MTSSESPQVTVSNDIVLARPARPEGFPVTWEDWDFVKSRVTLCISRLEVWELATSSFATACISFLIAAIVEKNWWFAAVCVATGVGALVSALARHSLGGQQKLRIDTVLQDMEQIERRYQRARVGAQ